MVYLNYKQKYNYRMIILKKYAELENEVLASGGGFGNYKNLTLKKLNNPKLEELFDKKVKSLEKLLNSFIKQIDNLELEGIAYTDRKYFFKVNKDFSLQISNRSINPAITFVMESRKVDRYVPFIEYDIEQRKFSSQWLTYQIKNTTFYKKYYNLSELANHLESNIMNVFRKEIDSKMDKNRYHLSYLGKFLYQNFQGTKNFQPLMQYPFKLKDVEEHIELEILRTDAEKPKLPKRIIELKNN